MFLNIDYSISTNQFLGLDMYQKKRILVALAMLAWGVISMSLVWYTKYEIVGIGGFLVLVTLNAYFKTSKLGGAA